MKSVYIIILALFTICSSCSKFLDIVPDNVATLENAFTMRSTAERYLFTCYSYLPNQGSIPSSPALMGGGEIWPLYVYDGNSAKFDRGEQNVISPLLNFWDGLNGGTDLYEGIRNCNIFLENIYNVPDMEEEEKDRWAAEVRFLKAYYHFILVRCYGPIPLIRHNLPIDADLDEVRASREPVDTCFNYIVQLLDEAIPDLPTTIVDDASELGRITQPIAVSVKALVLVTAASPLYNGNTDYVNYKDAKNGVLFNQTFDPEKWGAAMDAAKAAIEVCEAAGFQLYTFDPGVGQHLSDTTITKMSIRNAVCEKWNPEIIWTWTGAVATQVALTPRTWDPDRNHDAMQGRYGPPIGMINLFYSDHGVPIEEDKQWDYAGRYDIQMAGEGDKYNLAKDYQTAAMHFDRESRFYASTGFDGGVWYGQGKYDDNDSWHIEGRAGGYTSKQINDRYSPTGYWPKKLINYKNVVQTSSYSVTNYYWPNMRLADLYLLYAEAVNEYQGPGEEAYIYLNKVRKRAGLPTVQEAWTQYARDPNKYKSKDGLRAIIHREREIELAYEAKRLWDLLRWKTAQEELSKPVMGWDLTQSDPTLYYRETFVFQREFKKRDYFWPIREADIIQNENLLQSPGW